MTSLRFLVASLLVCGGLAVAVPTADAQTRPAVPESFRIGPEDVLAISVWDNKDLDRVVFVRPDGKISLPILGEVQAGGLTVADLTGQLNEAYAKTVKNALVTVSVQAINSRPIFFLGGVGRVGPMQLNQELTLLQAISAAGGVAEAADLESAYVLRGNERIAVDFVKLLRQGDLTQNIKVQPGDTIVVPVAEIVFVQGEVRAPGVVKYTSDLTMVKAIAQAGGFTPLAAPKRVTLLRGGAAKKENMRVNVQEMMTDPDEAPDMALKPNDIIIVPERLF